MACPAQAQGVTLQWRSLTYTVKVGFGKRRRSKKVLLDASGCVQPGHLLAVLGGTGGCSLSSGVMRRLAVQHAWCLLLGLPAWNATHRQATVLRKRMPCLQNYLPVLLPHARALQVAARAVC